MCYGARLAAVVVHFPEDSVRHNVDDLDQISVVGSVNGSVNGRWLGADDIRNARTSFR
jgi:hypothetical protein